MMIPQFEHRDHPTDSLRSVPCLSLVSSLVFLPPSSAQGPEREQPDKNHQGGFRRTETSASLVSATILIPPVRIPLPAGGKRERGGVIQTRRDSNKFAFGRRAHHAQSAVSGVAACGTASAVSHSLSLDEMSVRTEQPGHLLMQSC